MKIVFNISFEGSRKDMEFLSKLQSPIVEIIKQNQKAEEEEQQSDDSAKKK